MTSNPFDELLQRMDKLEGMIAGISPALPAEALEKPVTTDELCEFLAVTRPTIARYRKKNVIPFMIIGSAIRYDRRAVLKALESKQKRRG
jgi:excisionase family DNA binding protein